ncbi:hypothetical protein AURDEDRAFT_132193 [Auricularia subglabra TFB-10046 SS5]|uniref:Uncharacterized protein n=1 Tax=Auricularia subglabra (strain TFB-10046 / SS5) TaxID=717982 RepID=J0D124_AURST|nr:hypothetical protein AURDEDRAFT_132193 [Auricularia subglabra TFB-10046 SS5]
MIGIIRRRANYRLASLRVVHFAGNTWPGASHCWSRIFMMTLPLCQQISFLISNPKNIQQERAASSRPAEAPIPAPEKRLAPRWTLRSLSLSDVWIDGNELVLDAMPCLDDLHLKGGSIVLLEELRHTYVPLLSTIILEFDEHTWPPESLCRFAGLRREASVKKLLLSGTGWRFSDFVPAIIQWHGLEHLGLEGQIEPGFFDALGDRMPQTLASRLQVLEVIYSNPLNEILLPLVSFLRCKARISGNQALSSLLLRPVQGTAPCLAAAIDTGPIVPQFTRCGVTVWDVLNFSGPSFRLLRHLIRITAWVGTWCVMYRTLNSPASCIHLSWIMHTVFEMVFTFVAFEDWMACTAGRSLRRLCRQVFGLVYEVLMKEEGSVILMGCLKDSAVLLINIALVIASCCLS